MHVVAVGTGAAVRNAMNCDGDVLLVHSQQREEDFVASGYAPRRYALMYNDFILIGPKSDPARLAGGQDAVAALRKIAAKGHSFISRGDDLVPISKNVHFGRGLLSTQQPIPAIGIARSVQVWGQLSNIAVGLGAYTLSDRATWLKFTNKSDCKILRRG